MDDAQGRCNTRPVSSAPRQRHDLPAGTVTLLFTDIEGSTQLLRQLGDAYADVQDRHRRLAREAFARHGGHEVDTQGDAFMVSFSRAADAVAAAVSVQRALAGERWPGGVQVSVRMGMHTGAPSLVAEGYVGLDVVRASRICSVAHGGQVVLSQATRNLLADEPLPGGSLRSLGVHRLKDLPSVEPLFQLVVPGLRDAFPPLRTLAGATLPSLHHRLVGRREELAHIDALLAGGVQLVTICGAGGAGKSRLALEVAANAAETRPVYLVGLASISDAGLVPDAVARATGARENPGRTLVEATADVLSAPGTLLVLDNLEHLPGAAQQVVDLLEGSPGLEILATSRAPLRLARERVVALEPLPVDDAVTLFAELAESRGIRLPAHTEPAVREICHRLDGLPLAIELVAARLTVLSPSALLQGIESGLALTAEGPIDLPERQRTLRSAIDWSYGLLSASQRELHQAVSVFAGGCTVDDARAVSRSNGSFFTDLEALVTGSLIRSDVAADGEGRLSLLETVRRYALDELEAAGRIGELRDRHAERFLALAERAEAELSGPRQAAWLEQLEREHDNLRAAIDWLLAAGRVDDALRAVSALGRFWRAHAHIREARAWLAAGLEADADVEPLTRAKALWTAGRQASAQGDYATAEPLVQEALELFRATGAQRDVVFALAELCTLASQREDLDEAERTAREAVEIARTLGDPRAISAALTSLAGVAQDQSDYEHVRSLFGESLALRRTLDDPLLVASTAYNLGLAALLAEDLETAATALEESLTLARELGESIYTAGSACALGEIALARGEAATAFELLSESLALYTALGHDRVRAECLYGIGGVAASEGLLTEAAQLWGCADAIREGLGFALVGEERQILERFQDVVLDGLGQGAAAAARRAGRAAAVDELVTAVAGRLGAPARVE
jgi:predicted ATPase/class 3 adenylate cyclase